MRATLAYTSARILLFVAALGLLYLAGARKLMLVGLALVISGIVSFVVLSRQREAMSGALVFRFRQFRSRLDEGTRVRTTDRLGPPGPARRRALIPPGRPTARQRQPAAGGEQPQYRVGCLGPAQHRRVQNEIGVGRLLVRVGNPGEVVDNTGPGLGVQALPVPRLAYLDRRRHVDQQEVAGLADHPPDPGPRRRVRSDRRADRDPAVPGDLGGDVADPGNVQVAVARGRRSGQPTAAAGPGRHPAAIPCGRLARPGRPGDPWQSWICPSRTGRSGTARSPACCAVAGRAAVPGLRPAARTRPVPQRRRPADPRARPGASSARSVPGSISVSGRHTSATGS